MCYLINFQADNAEYFFIDKTTERGNALEKSRQLAEKTDKLFNKMLLSQHISIKSSASISYI